MCMLANIENYLLWSWHSKYFVSSFQCFGFCSLSVFFLLFAKKKKIMIKHPSSRTKWATDDTRSHSSLQSECIEKNFGLGRAGWKETKAHSRRQTVYGRSEYMRINVASARTKPPPNAFQNFADEALALSFVRVQFLGPVAICGEYIGV